MTEREHRERFEADMDAAREAWAEMAERLAAPIGTILTVAYMIFLLSGCTYFDAAHAVKEEGKVRLAAINDHYATDVAALPKTVPAGALARMPTGTEKCAMAALAGLQLVECQFVAVPGWMPR